MAEALLNSIGKSRFKAFSAGTSLDANQQPNPLALQALRNAGVSTEGLYCKSWDDFVGSNAPQMNLIITVCDDAADQVCPVWPGHPATAHWSFPDPSQGNYSDEVKAEAFRKTLHAIHRRLELFCSLPDPKLEQAMLQASARHLADS